MQIVRVGNTIERAGHTITTSLSCELSNGAFTAVRKVIRDWVCVDCFHGLRITVDGDVNCPNCGSRGIMRRGDVSTAADNDSVIMGGLPEDLQEAIRATLTEETHDLLWSSGYDERPTNHNVVLGQLPEDLRK